MDARTRAQSVKSLPESQRGLVASKATGDYALDSLSAGGEKAFRARRAKEAVRASVHEYKGAARHANRRNWRSALLDLFAAALVLYLVAFGFLAYAQNGTVASLPLNHALFTVAGLNPTVFPILFTLIVARFLKAYAHFKLERGATVGHLSHLLASRTLVSSFLAPLRYGSPGVLALGLFAFWCLSPLGGQASLRAVSTDANYTTIATNYHYLDINQSPLELLRAPNRPAPVDSAFIAALFSPIPSKNAAQDLFGNLRVPMLEVLKTTQKADSAGWYRTGQLAGLNSTSKALAKLEDFLGLTNDADIGDAVTAPAFASLTGIPFLRGVPVIPPGPGARNAAATDNTTMTLSALQEELFGAQSTEVVNTESQFNLETSYFYLDCKTSSDGKARHDNDFPMANNNQQGIVSNRHELAVQYDTNHTLNSTAPHNIKFISWSDHPGRRGGLTTASCGLTTTYVEANVYCSSGNNCSVQAVRASLLDHPSSMLSQLDGISPPFNDSSLAERQSIPQLFFSGFVNATSKLTENSNGISPVECYFLHPENPYYCSVENTPYAIDSMGDHLFSQRFTQLLNTYWVDNVAPYSVTGNYTLNNMYEKSASATSPGQTRMETEVLRCHTILTAILIAISAILFLLGLATAYLDATRRGPDILDDLVSLLRHSPYVHVEAGSSMESGGEKTRRLRNTLIRMGDVRPDDPVGHVAIGTPSERQPVRMLQHDRGYR